MPSIEPLYRDVGLKIQTRRNKLGLSQERLGSVLKPKVTRASIANIEAGKQRILTHTLVQLAEALDLEVSALLPEKNARSVTLSHFEAKLAEHNIPTKTIKRLLKASQR